MITRVAGILSAVALSTTLTFAAGPQNAKADPARATVAGTWTMQLMSHQVGLVLEQDGTKVTGTMMMMGTDVKVDGEFVDGVLTLGSNAKIGARGGDAGHGVPADGVALKLTAKLQDDGTLAGEMPGPNGPSKWTAERLKEKKPKPPVASGPGLTGAWKFKATTPNGALEGDLTLKQDGEKITGSLDTEHAGNQTLTGTFAQGVLKFATGGAGAEAMHLDFTAKLKDDGTLAGEVTVQNSAMPWTAARVKK